MKTSEKKSGKVAKLIMLNFLLLFTVASFAQQGPNADQKREKIKAQKVAFITQKLNLTADESAKFWPVYNEYDAQKESLNKAFRQKTKGYKNVTLTDSQADSLIIANIEHEQALLDLKKAYIAKFKSVISTAKVAQLGEAEKQFNQELLKYIKDQKKSTPPPQKNN